MSPITPDPDIFNLTESRYSEYLQQRGLLSDKIEPARHPELMLCAACLDGQHQAWKSFIDQYRPFIMGVALRCCRNADSAEELVSETIADLVEKKRLDQFRGRGSLKGWLRAIVVHRFLDQRRKAKRQQFDALDENLSARLAASENADECEKYFRKSLLNDLATVIISHMKELSDKHASLVNLHYFQRKTLAEAAQLLGVHESTASRWNTKVMSELSRQLSRYLIRKKSWSESDMQHFIEICLQHLAERLEELNRFLPD